MRKLPRLNDRKWVNIKCQYGPTYDRSTPGLWHAQMPRFGLRVVHLGWKDSNLRVAVPKTAALPLGYTPSRLNKEKIYGFKCFFCKIEVCKLSSSRLIIKKITG